MGDGLQPERRAEARAAVEWVRRAGLAVIDLHRWETVDVLTKDQLVEAEVALTNLQDRLGSAHAQVTRALLKRENQSASGKYQPQIELLERRLAEAKQTRVDDSDLVEENANLRAQIEQARTAVTQARVALSGPQPEAQVG